MNIENTNLFKPTNRRERHYAAKWMLAGLSLIGSVALADAGIHGAEKVYDRISSEYKESGTVPNLTPEQRKELTKYYVVEPGNTVWSIATAEGPAIADNPESMSVAENEISAQLKDKNAGLLQVGQEIRLPADSEIGSTKPIP